ncbi:AAA family ATPase [Paraburkholderia sp. Ac-20347]|uniref:AAA family ATPase n=1 Tax=Paraburkholderia sp. Ac-20347 TaxID=2703892 RepID=UPI001982560B|nr:AAA family ATPase [Paraburkholderia sp. Ac-20347]MBN3809430.1 AAA family ATPase [Paraburkholderia sp. Ac-20347]
MTNDILIGALAPIFSRVVTSHCWVKRNGKLSHLRDPLTRERMAHHLNGGPYYGCAQIAPGSSTTRIACLDFDDHARTLDWDAMRAAATAVCAAAETMGLRPLPFRSSGGAGIHVYFLWDAPQDAHSVRACLRELLLRCELAAGTKGLAAGQVEIFPKQDSVPADGYGNMFVLPLAGQSVPLDAFELDDMPREYAAQMEWAASAAVPVVVPEERAAPVTDVPVGLETLKLALDAIPNSGPHELDYDAWRNVIFGIHHATQGSDDGHALAHAFSARSGKYNPDFLDARVWPHIGKTSDETRPPVTARSILHLAREYGFEEPMDDEFDPLEPEATAARENSFELVLTRSNEAIKPDLIKGVVPDAAFGIIFGAPGAGKSFIAIDLGFHLALGRSWRGRKTRQRTVFYVAAEGALGVRKRARAYAMHYGVEATAPFYSRERGVNLYAKNGWVKAAEDINALGGHGVVIIDTLSRSIPGVEENSAKDMSQVIENCHALGRATACMVIVVAHAGKDAERGVRGSSTLRAAADFELSVTRHLETQWRCVKVTKAKDDIDGTEFGFTLSSVEVGVDADGETAYSAVAVPSDERPAEVAQRPRSAAAARAVDAYTELAEFTDDGWVEIEAIIDRALQGQPDAGRQARFNVRRWISGANKLEIFDVFDGKARVSASQNVSDDI